MDDRVRSAIARIDVIAENGTSVSRGTGFLVTDRLVLTALHVVAQRRDPPAPLPGSISVQFPGQRVIATIHESPAGTPSWDLQSDWVLLECEPVPRLEPVPLATLQTWGAQWETFGFPDTKPDGMVHSGTVEDLRATLEGVPAYQLFSKQAAAGNGAPVRGLSGAPVIVGDAVVGHLRFALMKDMNTADERTVAATLFACPLAALAARYPALGRPSALIERPGWNRRGVGWLVLAAAACVLTVSLLTLLFRNSRTLWPSIAATGAIVWGLLRWVLSWNPGPAPFQRLSQVLARSRPLKAGIAVFSASIAAGWIFLGRHAINCPLEPCKGPGETRIVLAESEASPAGPETAWSEETREALKMKFSLLADRVRIMSAECPNPATADPLDIDYCVNGFFASGASGLRLIAKLRRHGEELVAIRSQPFGGMANALIMMALQNDITDSLLQRFGLSLTIALRDSLRRIPTPDTMALHWNNAGVNLLLDGNYPEAETRFMWAIERDSGYADAFANRAEALRMQGSCDTAEAELKSAIARLRQYAPYHYGLGELYLDLRQPGRAVEAYTQAINLDPDLLEASEGLALAYMQDSVARPKWYFFAKEQLEASMQRPGSASHPKLFRRRGELYLAHGSPDSALVDFDSALVLYRRAPLADPLQRLDSAKVFLLQAEAYGLLGNVSLACQNLLKSTTSLVPEIPACSDAEIDGAAAAEALSARLGCTFPGS